MHPPGAIHNTDTVTTTTKGAGTVTNMRGRAGPSVLQSAVARILTSAVISRLSTTAAASKQPSIAATMVTAITVMAGTLMVTMVTSVATDMNMDMDMSRDTSTDMRTASMHMAAAMIMVKATSMAHMAATVVAGAGQAVAGKGGASACSALPSCRWCCCT